MRTHEPTFPDGKMAMRWVEQDRFPQLKSLPPSSDQALARRWEQLVALESEQQPRQSRLVCNVVWCGVC